MGERERSCVDVSGADALVDTPRGGVMREVRDLFAEHAWPVLRSRSMLAALGLLLAVDAMILLLHAAHMLADAEPMMAPFGGPAFSLETDGGIGEWFEYAKTALCGLALLGCWRLSRQPIHLALAVVFGVLLLDNALEFHEAWGVLAHRVFWRADGLFENGSRHLAELSFFVLVGVAALAAVLLGLRWSTRRHRVLGLCFLALLLALGGFGAGVDLLHAMLFHTGQLVERALGVLEDGGELVILSLACSFALAIRVRLGRGWQG